MYTKIFFQFKWRKKNKPKQRSYIKRKLFFCWGYFIEPFISNWEQVTFANLFIFIITL